MTSERRLKIYWVDKHDMVDLLNLLNNPRQYVQLYWDLPADAKCESVTYDWQRDAFGFRMEHPSFAPVSPGQEIPWGSPLIRRMEQFLTREVQRVHEERTMDRLAGITSEMVESGIVSRQAVIESGPPLPPDNVGKTIYEQAFGKISTITGDMIARKIAAECAKHPCPDADADFKKALKIADQCSIKYTDQTAKADLKLPDSGIGKVVGGQVVYFDKTRTAYSDKEPPMLG